jgi:hypothetical protein
MCHFGRAGFLESKVGLGAAVIQSKVRTDVSTSVGSGWDSCPYRATGLMAWPRWDFKDALSSTFASRGPTSPGS